MGKLMKGGISYGGVADIDILNEPVVLTMEEIPSNPSDGMTILFEGESTASFIKGHIYQYSATESEWVELTGAVDSIPIADVQDLFD